MDIKLLEIERAVPYRYSTIEYIFNIVNSYEATDSILSLAMRTARCPVAIADLINDIKIK